MNAVNKIIYTVSVRLTLMLLGIGLATAGCGGDDVTPGVSDECGSFGGAGLECDFGPIDSIDDVCNKMLGCGVFPLESDGFDWQSCMNLADELTDLNRDIIFACVEVSSCDELKRVDGDRPLCLQHGDI